MTVLVTTVARVVALLRGIALAEVVVQVIIWRSFYRASPWLLCGPAATIAWGGTTIAYLRRHHPRWHRPRWQLVCLDSAVYAAIAFGATWCVPTAIRGEAASWLFILVTSQAVAPLWFAPRALAVPLAAVPGAAFALGTLLAPAAGAVTAGPRRASLALMFVVVALHWLVRRMLSGRAAGADAALAGAHREARDQYVLLSRNVERREQDRLMHDTILNTLTAIARTGGTPAVVSRCRQDIALLEAALAESGGMLAAGRPGPGAVAAIEAVAAQMRAHGLAVDLEVTGAGAARPDAREPAWVPGPVAAALAHATREALANVAAHACTGRAWVTVDVTPPGDPDAPGRIEVTVRDAGAGFDPTRIDPARLGVRRSITERVEDWGGSVRLRSVPGEGTVVRLCWPAARPGVMPAGLPASGATSQEVPGPC
jgi:signal transduction histidine kinase